MDEEMVSEGWLVGAPGFFSLTEACRLGLYESLRLFYSAILTSLSHPPAVVEALGTS